MEGKVYDARYNVAVTHSCAFYLFFDTLWVWSVTGKHSFDHLQALHSTIIIIIFFFSPSQIFVTLATSGKITYILNWDDSILPL